LIKRPNIDSRELSSLRMEYESLLTTQSDSRIEPALIKESRQHSSERLALFGIERRILIDLYDKGEISFETFTALENELDIRESWFQRKKA
jgi:hypothetical protein